MSINGMKSVPARWMKSIRPFADAGIFFPAANVCNFMQGGDALATKIAIANLLYSALLIAASSSAKQAPETSLVRQFYNKLPNPLRVTSYCALIVGILLLANAANDAALALFPGVAGIFFGIGNFFQSSAEIQNWRRDNTRAVLRAVTHPAVWYGLGYAMTGIGIGGGLSLLADPFSDKVAFFLTFIGIIETMGALGLMASGTVVNQAAPFVGVAAGTACFAVTGFATGNVLGAATGMFACAGELSLAILMQKLHNASAGQAPSSKIENILTAPICWAMKRGWICSVPVAD